MAATVGCDGGQVDPQPEPPRGVGKIVGRVWWAGNPPQSEPITAPIPLGGGKVEYRQFPNPNEPRIDPQTKAVRGAVVMLVDAPPSPPDSPTDPLRLRIDIDGISLRSGDQSPERTALLPVGGSVEMASTDSSLHVLTARGAAFFGLAFPEPQRPIKRTLTRPGLVEFSSGSAKYWHRAYLWVCPHRWYAITDAEGRYELPNVPAGSYQLRIWHPNGNITSLDRDPNTGMTLRYHFAPPITSTREVIVRPGEESNTEVWLLE